VTRPTACWRLSAAPENRNGAVKVRGNLTTNDGEIAVNWALDGHGILMRAEWDIERYLDSGRLVQVLPQYRTPDADIYAYIRSISISRRGSQCMWTKAINGDADHAAVLGQQAVQADSTSTKRCFHWLLPLEVATLVYCLSNNISDMSRSYPRQFHDPNICS
jgi:hypothetical protein